jgi:hypothetical protein
LSDSHKRVCSLATILTFLMFPFLSLAEDKNDGFLKSKKEGVSWSGVLKQSGLFLAMQQSIRIIYEADTRLEFRGPFFKDYFESVRGLHGWSDGDTFPVNYLGHPWMGAVAGRIFVQNDPSGKSFTFSNNKLYWQSRLKALGWSAVYSTTFELSPAGEAAIGNVGGKPWPDGMAYCDLVNTPLIGTGILVLEDLTDRYVANWLEQRVSFVPLTAFTRTFMNPARSMANVMRFKWPWYRDSRPGVRAASQTHQSTAHGKKD